MFALGAALGKAAFDYFGAPMKAALQQNKEVELNRIDTEAREALEKVLEAGFSGLNTKAGDLMTIKINQRDVPTLNLATGMRVILHSDNILNIRDTGVEVFD